MAEILNIEATKEEVVNLLKTITSEDKNKNLYEHLQELFNTKLHMQDDEKFLDLFEDISYRLRKQGFYIPENDKESKIKTYLEYYVQAVKDKKVLLEPLVKKDGEEITPITSVGFVPDYYMTFQQLEWCGISISEKESYLLTNSLRTLCSDKNLPSVSFWGKIFGKDKDYYIVETAAVEGGGKYKINYFLIIQNQQKSQSQNKKQEEVD